MSGSQQLLLGGSVAVPVDPYFYSVTSLLHGDGTNGGQNNTFLDSSTNNFTITRNGNTTQGAFSPFSQTGWSNYFDGTANGSFTATDSGSVLDLDADFTIEFWLYQPALSTLNAPSGLNMFFSVDTLNRLQFYQDTTINLTINGSSIVSSATRAGLNQWCHYAIVRSGSTVTVYLNGISIGSGTSSYSIACSLLMIGGQYRTGYTNNTFHGCNAYISNFRVVKGTAVYTANFTVPTTPLTAISGTSLLTCQANRFVDSSSNALVLGLGSAVSVQPFSPFNPTTAYSTSAVGGSGYFDGSGDSLTFTDSSNALDLGGATASFECWIYAPNVSSGQGIFNKSGNTDSWNTSNGYEYNVYITGGTINFYYNNAGTGTTGVSGSIVANQWTHVAVATNSSNAISLYINGTRVSTATNAITKPTTRTSMRIGNTVVNEFFSGYISGLRFISGSGAYDASQTTITIPTAPPTAITNTSLLCNFTNGAIFDNAAVADYETVGNAQISTSVKKYGTGSIAFDGTGDYLNAPSRQITALTGDFTIEFWAYRNSGNFRAFNIGDDNLSTGLGLVYNNSLDDWFLYNSNASQITTGTLATTTWTHVAVNRTAGVVKLYLNGTQAGSWSSTATFSGAVYIGAELYSGTVYSDTNGYIDDFRISNGVGRYPYNFTPPTAEFPNIGGTVTLTADPYYDYTTLLLPGNGTNGAQNNTFLDSSSNAFSITRNGNTTQGTFSPFSQTGWGNYFDGSGDYLETPSNAAFTLGSSGDFTVECWVYATATPGNYAAFMTTWSDANTGYSNRWFLGVHDSKIKWYNDAGASAIADSSNIQLNTWLHVAAVRSGSTITLYINGTAIGTQTTSQSYTTQGTVKLGYSGTGGNYFYGYISNARVVKGTAVYTANFTPPTAPLTAITNTSLLTCQSNRFIDNSSNAFAITRNGDVSVQAFSPFNPTAAWSASTNGGSGYFDGSGDYISAPSNAAFDLGSGNFTMEAWIYPTSYGAAYGIIFARYTSGGASNQPFFLSLETNGTVRAGINGTYTLQTTATAPLNAWTHVAWTRSGNDFTIWLNGVSSATLNQSVTVNNPSIQVDIGAFGLLSSNYFTGYIANARIVKGTAVYTAAFTPPTAPLTAITNTQLLLSCTNAGIYDATSKNDLETVGNAQISTTQSKFGGSSMYFDGTGDYLLPNSPASNNILALGSGDFTIEFWARFSALGDRIILDGRPSSTQGAYPTILTAVTTNKLQYYANSAIQITSTNALSIDTWYHIAIVRYSGSTKMYINGVNEGSTYADSTNYLTSSNRPVIGASGYTEGSFASNFYINDLRITKGIARYTSNFTPPTTAFLTL